MKKVLLLLLSLGVFATISQAQGIRGKIINGDNDEPLPFATIYIKQLETGTASNVEGRYEYRLKPGVYDVLFRYLGYKTVEKKIEVGADFVALDITLNPQIVELREVEVSSKAEDPAYTIMRKAIAKSKFHRLQVQEYSAKVYVKGSGRLKDYPFFLKKPLEQEGIDTSTYFLTESVSEISFEQPNTFKEKVISVRTIGEDNASSPNGYINGSFYEPELAGAISPLSPKAFSYYRFQLLGSYFDGQREVNKIRVIPRSRGDNVFSGLLYIVEDLWSIHSLNLSTYKQGIKFVVKQLYEPIQETVWLPVTHRFEVEGSIFGLEFEYKYLATVSNYQVTVNPDLQITELVVVDEKIEKELAKALEKEDSLDFRAMETEAVFAEKKKFTRKELKKVMKDYEKELEKMEEEPEVIENYTMTIDSLAGKKDSTYWAEIRPIPLNELEVRSYKKLDSMAVAEKQKQEADTVTTKKRKSANKISNTFSDVLFQKTFKLNKHTSLEYKSPLMDLTFNTVEGYVFNLPLTLRHRKEKKRFELGVVGRYGFAREEINGKFRTAYRWNRTPQNGQIALEGGRFVSQFNEQEAISPVINSLSTLFWERNFLKIYEKDYLKGQYFQRIIDGMYLRTSLEWARRRELFNNSDLTIIDKDDRAYTPNAPVNAELPEGTSFPENDALLLGIELDYEPFRKYRIRNGNKQLISKSSPIFNVVYRKGFNDIAGSDVDFDLLELGFKHRIEIGVRGRLDVNLYSGAFLNNESLSFMDFRHFPGNRTVLQESDPVGSFRMLDYYLYSTQDRYFGGHLYYQFRKFLLTQIFEVQIAGLKENLLYNHLKTDASPHYSEIGYSLDNILRFLRVEAVAMFEDYEYQSWGIRIGVSTSLEELFGD